ncbi:hypothetical protein Tsp_02996 [Trichinella spiralis]|uniref:hypothetical protein n=1 Tax=Trichinella spiralis TaxID=6334 RepID=UPI0001EFB3DE|nr:hypothetical protein Tsp_02996 [Trichinella spiralis]
MVGQVDAQLKLTIEEQPTACLIINNSQQECLQNRRSQFFCAVRNCFPLSLLPFISYIFRMNEYSRFVCCQLISGYPIGILEASSSTPSADEVLKAKEMADIVMQSYVDGFNNDAYAEQPIHRTESTDDDDEMHATATHLPGAISKDQESKKRPSETSTVDSSQTNVVTVNEEESTDYIADPLYDPVTSSNVIVDVETKLNDTFPPVQSWSLFAQSQLARRINQ